MLRRLIFALVLLVTAATPAGAQILGEGGKFFNADSIRRDFRDQPYFGLYKDNYFVFGPALGQHITRANTNIKFQISIAQRITNATLPWGTYLYLFYSQKCFWNVLEDSMPMTDLNFNPGIGLAKPVFVKNRYIGKVTLMVEHESNGRDSTASRSWNKVSLAANVLIDRNIMIHGKVWIPIIDGMHNKDILKYCGIYQCGMQVISNNKRLCGGVTLVKRKGWNFNYNVIVDLAYKITSTANEYLFLQIYNGYGEGLLEYNKYHSQIRAGILIKPNLFSDF